MLRRLVFLLALTSLFTLAWAQVDISPTGPTGEADTIVRTDDGAPAEVDQTVSLLLPQMNAIHLNAPQITFDLTAAGWADNLSCVTTTGADTGGDFNDQPQRVPGGIAYKANTWNDITLIYSGNGKAGDVPASELATKYAPAEFEDGRLVAGSKDYFVCYQTFIMQLFSNGDSWSLTVDRDDTTDQGIEHLYIQANTCADFGRPTGLYALPDETEGLNLLPTDMTNESTGALAMGGQCAPNKSWLDVLGVLAVKVNSDRAGTNVANLTYTLTSVFPGE